MIIRLSTGLRDAMMGAGGQSMADALANGTIELRTGTIPASADDAVTGTKVVSITESGLPFSSGVATNGINLDVSTDGEVAKAAAETWTGDNGVSDVVGYGIFYANVVDQTASTTAVRVYFDVSTSGAFLNLSTTTLTISEPTTITAFSLTQPE